MSVGAKPQIDDARISTGNVGLDNILGAGVDANRMYFLEGVLARARRRWDHDLLLRVPGEVSKCSTSPSRSLLELRKDGIRHGWSLDKVEIFELVPPETTLDPDRELIVRRPAEVESTETKGLIFDKVEALNLA